MAARPDDDNLLAGFFDRSLAALAEAAADRELRALIGAIAEAIEVSLRAGGKLLIAGNGGSAADAQHLAAEFLSRYVADRRPLLAAGLRRSHRHSCPHRRHCGVVALTALQAVIGAPMARKNTCRLPTMDNFSYNPIMRSRGPR